MSASPSRRGVTHTARKGPRLSLGVFSDAPHGGTAWHLVSVHGQVRVRVRPWAIERQHMDVFYEMDDSHARNRGGSSRCHASTRSRTSDPPHCGATPRLRIRGGAFDSAEDSFASWTAGGDSGCSTTATIADILYSSTNEIGDRGGIPHRVAVGRKSGSPRGGGRTTRCPPLTRTRRPVQATVGRPYLPDSGPLPGGSGTMGHG